MVIGCAINAVKNLNIVPGGKACVSLEMNPLTLITSPNFDKVTAVQFGDYAQVHEANGLRNNSNDTRSVGAIALYPSGNQQGSWYFLSLNTNRVLHQYNWTSLPIPNDVVARVEQLATEKGQPIIANNFIFEYAPGVPIDEDEGAFEQDNEDQVAGAQLIPIRNPLIVQQQPLLIEEEEQFIDEEEPININDELPQNDFETIDEHQEENDVPTLELEEDSDSDDDDVFDEDQEDQTVVIEDAPAPDVTFNETTNLLDAEDDELGGNANTGVCKRHHKEILLQIAAWRQHPEEGAISINYNFYSRRSNNQDLHKTI